MEDQPQLNESPDVAQKADEILVPPTRRVRRLRGWRLALVVCSVLVVGIMTMIAIFALTLFKTPAFQEAMEQYRVMAGCEDHLGQIGAALTRYSRSNDGYPDELEDLYPEYLPSRSVFRCPADHRDRNSGPSSYFYERPTLHAPDDAVVCVCTRHRLMKGQPRLLVELLKNGEVAHVAVKKTK